LRSAELKSANWRPPFKQGKISEAFGTGTAAVVAPIATININGIDHLIQEPAADSFQLRVKNLLKEIRLGLKPDTHGWNHVI